MHTHTHIYIYITYNIHTYVHRHKICTFQAVKTLTAEGDLAAQIMRAAAVAFGGGRKGDYPKAWRCGSPVAWAIFGG